MKVTRRGSLLDFRSEYDDNTMKKEPAANGMDRSQI